MLFIVARGCDAFILRISVTNESLRNQIHSVAALIPGRHMQENSCRTDHFRSGGWQSTCNSVRDTLHWKNNSSPEPWRWRRPSCCWRNRLLWNGQKTRKKSGSSLSRLVLFGAAAGNCFLLPRSASFFSCYSGFNDVTAVCWTAQRTYSCHPFSQVASRWLLVLFLPVGPIPFDWNYLAFLFFWGWQVSPTSSCNPKMIVCICLWNNDRLSLRLFRYR